MNKKLIITADDFGRNRANDQAIIQGHRYRLITRTSIFTTHDEFTDEVKLLTGTPTLVAGVHLDISSGRPVLDQGSSTLIQSDGKFIAGADKKALAKIDPMELEREFRGQIKKFLHAGLKLNHLDNHRPEIYFYPKLFEVSIKLAAEYQVPLRSPFDPWFLKNIEATAKSLGLPVAALQNVADQSNALIAKYQVQTSDYFRVLDDSLRNKEAFAHWLETLEPGTTELCTHPGASVAKESEEITLLQDPEIKKMVRSLGISVVSEV